MLLYNLYWVERGPQPKQRARLHLGWRRNGETCWVALDFGGEQHRAAGEGHNQWGARTVFLSIQATPPKKPLQLSGKC